MKNRLHDKVVKGSKKQKPVPVKIVSESPTINYDDMKYRARDALSTLSRAEEIKRDKTLMKAVKAEAKMQVKSLTNMCK